MFDKPLFQDNILQNLWFFNKTYLTTRDWPLWIFGVLILLIGTTFLLRKALRNKNNYKNIFSNQIYSFNIKNCHHWTAFGLVVLATLACQVYTYYGENNLFENFDLMAINTTRTMRYGLVASFDYIRAIPFASWYLSTLYAITQNIYMIKFFVLLQNILVIWTMYAFFNYIPVVRRLIMIAVFLILPTYMQTYNIIFPERDMIIALMLSLIFARKYSHSHKVRWAFVFILFCNFAIYTKETCLTFYLGILLASIIYQAFKGKLNYQSFLHPLKTITQMPIEFLIGLSLLCYSIIFVLLQNGENFYLSANNQPLFQQLKTYWLEIIILIAAIVVAIKNLYTNGDRGNPLFQEGLVLGALCSGLLVVVIFKLSPSTPHLAGRSYYMLASTIFTLAYLFEHISSRLLIGLLSGFLIIYSVYTNINYKRAEVGQYYREVAEFMAQNSTPGSVTQIFVMEGPYATKTLWQWIVETWSTAYRYYFNDRTIVFKSDVHYLDRTIVGKLQLYARIPLIYFPIVPQALPQSNEWLIINKRNHTTKAENARRSRADQKVFENNLFEVYKPQ